MIMRILMLAAGLCACVSVTAQDESFFTDPSLLKPLDHRTFDLRYRHPDIEQITQGYSAVMLDQPEILLADDSRYKGAKGDHLKQLADAGRLAMAERLTAGDWDVVEEPGPDVLFIRWAISDLYLKKKKKKRGILSYTPVGLIVHTTAQAAIRDLWAKIDIVELSLKIEVQESVSGQVLAAGVAREGMRKGEGQKRDLVTWEELDALFATMGEQTRCRLDNKKLSEAEKRQDCTDIVIEPAQ